MVAPTEGWTGCGGRGWMGGGVRGIWHLNIASSAVIIGRELDIKPAEKAVVRIGRSS